MKYILAILMFFPIFLLGQDSLNLCGSLKKSYKVFHTGDTFTINVTPYTFNQVEADIVYIEYNSVGTYVITATTYKGECLKEDKLIVNVLECDSTLIWIPNSFTPNQDVNNPEFGAYGININEFRMTIWDRWGNMIFVSNSITKRWDGNSPSGRPYQDDVYSYVVTYKDNKKRDKQIFGRVTLIR
jgi:gliding motility-associated-like protein